MQHLKDDKHEVLNKEETNELSVDQELELGILKDLGEGKLLDHLPTLQDLVEMKLAGKLTKKSFDKMEGMGVIAEGSAEQINKIRPRLVRKPRGDPSQQTITSYFTKGKHSRISDN